jgi:tetratricopeptide (TPR) repeat protein
MPTEADIRKRSSKPISTSGFGKAQSLVKQPGTSAELALRVIGKVHENDQLIQVGSQLIELAEHAYGCRQLDRLAEISQTLSALPLPRPYISAASYFRGLELIRRGDLVPAKSLLESAASERRHAYSARAILSLGVVFHRLGDLESALKLYLDANHCSTDKGNVDLVTGVMVTRNLAVFKSMHGDHRGALEDLERMAACAEAIAKTHPYIYYDYQNSYAVEYGELGLFEEAEQAARIALSSRFAIAYPEWLQTFNELKARNPRASRSSIPVQLPSDHHPDKPASTPQRILFRLPLIERTGEVTTPERHQGSRQARILSFQRWKDSIRATNVSPTKVITPEQRRGLSSAEKLIRIMDLISNDETDDETIDCILEAVEEIVLKRRTSID